MADEKAGAPPGRGGRSDGGNQRGPGGGPGGGGRGPGGFGGGQNRRDGKGGGKGRPGQGPAKVVRAEIYETLKELTRGEGFRIDKFVAAEKGTHRPVKTEYRLTREGLKGVHVFQRLSEAQAAATAPLPEPEPEPEIVEVAAEETVETETAESGEAHPVEEPAEHAPHHDEPAHHDETAPHEPPADEPAHPPEPSEG